MLERQQEIRSYRVRADSDFQHLINRPSIPLPDREFLLQPKEPQNISKTSTMPFPPEKQEKTSFLSYFVRPAADLGGPDRAQPRTSPDERRGLWLQDRRVEGAMFW